MSSKRSYLDVYKILWAVLFNFCFKEDKGIAAVPRKEDENTKHPTSAQDGKSSIFTRKKLLSELTDGSPTEVPRENARELKARL